MSYVLIGLPLHTYLSLDVGNYVNSEETARLSSLTFADVC
jgi:hypothetical protein